MPAILVAMLFRYIFAFRLFSEVWLLTQGGPARSTEVVAVYLYLEAFRYNDFGVATATGWIMVLASLAARRRSTCAGSTGEMFAVPTERAHAVALAVGVRCSRRRGSATLRSLVLRLVASGRSR